MASTPAPVRRPWLLVLALAVLLPLVRPGQGEAADDWEALIVEGMRQQDQRMKQVSNADALVREYYLYASRATGGATKISRSYLLGRAYGKRLDAKQRDLENAREEYRAVLALAPNCWFAWRDLAILATKTTPPDLREAEADLQKALSYQPSYVQALRDLARLCQEQDRPADAVVHLRRVIDLAPTDPMARAYLALALLKLKRPAEAEREVALLRRGDPQNPVFRDLEAQVLLAQDRAEEAIAIWKGLRDENRSSLQPLWGLYEAYSRLIQRGVQVPKGELKGVIQRLLLLEPEGERKQRLREVLASLDAPPPDPSKPPDDPTLVKALAAPDAELREKALKYLVYKKEPPSNEVLVAVVQRLGSEKEPAPEVREAALYVLGRHGGLGTVRLVRLLLEDPAPSVRQAAVLALMRIGTQSPDAARAALLALALHVRAADPALASDARDGVLMLAQGVLEPLEEGVVETSALRAQRWGAWWASAAGTDAKIRALAAYEQARDFRAESVLAPYLDDADFFVLKAAYEALAKMADYLPDPARRQWAAGIPRLLPGELQPEKRDTILKSLRTWLATRPGR